MPRVVSWSPSFFFDDTATTEIYTVGNTLSLHDALPISPPSPSGPPAAPPYLMTEYILSPLPGNKATFDEIDIYAKWDINPSPDITDFWKARIDTKGTSDLYVVR